MIGRHSERRSNNFSIIHFPFAIELMLIIPAIDFKDGRCVRLFQGDMDQETVYFEDPVAAARHWVAEGATFLHIVDLNGAVEGRPVHTKEVAAICQRRRTVGGTGRRAAIDRRGASGDRLGCGARGHRHRRLRQRRVAPDFVQEISRQDRRRHRCAPGQGRGQRLEGDHRDGRRRAGASAANRTAPRASSTPTSAATAPAMA